MLLHWAHPGETRHRRMMLFLSCYENILPPPFPFFTTWSSCTILARSASRNCRSPSLRRNTATSSNNRVSRLRPLPSEASCSRSNSWKEREGAGAVAVGGPPPAASDPESESVSESSKRSTSSRCLRRRACTAGAEDEVPAADEGTAAAIVEDEVDAASEVVVTVAPGGDTDRLEDLGGLCEVEKGVMEREGPC